MGGWRLFGALTCTVLPASSVRAQLRPMAAPTAQINAAIVRLQSPMALQRSLGYSCVRCRMRGWCKRSSPLRNAEGTDLPARSGE